MRSYSDPVKQNIPECKHVIVYINSTKFKWSEKIVPVDVVMKNLCDTFVRTHNNFSRFVGHAMVRSCTNVDMFDSTPTAVRRLSAVSIVKIARELCGAQFPRSNMTTLA